MSDKTTNEKSGLNPKYTLCPEFMKLVHLVMDGEASNDEEKEFIAHIEASQDCQKHYKEEQEIRSIIREKCGSIKVPNQLIRLIQDKLQEQRTA